MPGAARGDRTAGPTGRWNGWPAGYSWPRAARSHRGRPGRLRLAWPAGSLRDHVILPEPAAPDIADQIERPGDQHGIPLRVGDPVEGDLQRPRRFRLGHDLPLEPDASGDISDPGGGGGVLGEHLGRGGDE